MYPRKQITYPCEYIFLHISELFKLPFGIYHCCPNLVFWNKCQLYVSSSKTQGNIAAVRIKGRREGAAIARQSVRERRAKFIAMNIKKEGPGQVHGFTR